MDEPAEVPLTVFPFVSNLAAVVGGLGLGIIACVAGDQHPDLIRLSDVLGQWDVWMITNPEVRNNTRVRAVKEAMVELLEAAAERLSGGKMEPQAERGWRPATPPASVPTATTDSPASRRPPTEEGAPGTEFVSSVAAS
ncbi:MAG: hypothetical protein ABUS79_24805 [Pseudomonadota bacterium]